MLSSSTSKPSRAQCRLGKSLGSFQAATVALLIGFSPVLAFAAQDDTGKSTTKSSASQPGSNDFTALTLTGQPFDPFIAKTNDVAVLIFVGIDCPISNRYAPEVRKLCERFASQEVSFWLVQPDPDVTAKQVRRHLKEFNYPCEALRDPKHHLVKKAQATKVPECAVFNRGGELVYHGRINNRYADFGRARPQATEHELRAAIEAALEGRKPPKASVPAVGCHIPDLP